MKRIVSLVMMLLLIVSVSVVMVADANNSDLIVGTWETQKVIEGKLATITYEFKTDGTVDFTVSVGENLISQALIPGNIHYVVRDDLLFISLISESKSPNVFLRETSAIVLKIVYVDEKILKIIDVPITESNIRTVVSGEKADKIVILRRKLKEV